MQGSGGRLAHPAGSARGSARSHPRSGIAAPGSRIRSGIANISISEEYLPNIADQSYLREQYKNATNLNDRIQLHVRFSTNRYDFHMWVFDQLKLAAKRMALTLGGDLVDDNQRPLTDNALAAIRAQVVSASELLARAQIEPGSPRAHKLFAA